MAKTKEEIVAALIGIYEDVCLLNGQGVDKPVPRSIQGVIQSLDPRNGLISVRNVKLKLRNQPKAEKSAPVQPAAPAELGKPQGAQPVRQPQPLKVVPEQVPQPEVVLTTQTKSEGVAEAENVAVVEPLTADEIESMLSMKPIEAEENYSAERVRATLVSLGTDASGLEIKTYRQLFNITRNYFA